MDWDNDDLVPLSSAIIIAMGSALRDAAIVETAVDRTINRSESAHSVPLILIPKVKTHVIAGAIPISMKPVVSSTARVYSCPKEYARPEGVYSDTKVRTK